jgi:hypothetical protein
MLKQCVAAIGITLLAGPVSALSCMQPNITETFNSLADAPETYILALGTVTQTGPQQPLADGREGYRFAAHMTGMQVTRSGCTTFTRNDPTGRKLRSGPKLRAPFTITPS